MSSDCKSMFLRHGVDVESSVLSQVAYDEQRAVLYVTFREGATYQYLSVPRQAYSELLRAESKGAYFNRHIRNVFPCARDRNAFSAPRTFLG